MKVQNSRSIRPKNPTTVCLCWLHPVVLADFRRLLSGNGLRVRERTQKAAPNSDHEARRLPRASVYVLEAQHDAAITQAVVARVLAHRPGGRVLVVAERFDQRSAFSLLRLGVKGLLSFDEVATHLRRAVKEVAREGFWVSRSLLSRFVDSTLRALPPLQPQLRAGPARLSRREHQVCTLLLENLSNRDIARRLEVSERTAKFHVSNLLAKYGLKRRADLVVLSYSQLLGRTDLRGARAPASTGG